MQHKDYYSENFSLLVRDNNFLCVIVASQSYHVTVPDDSVIVGNDVIVKCNIPSFVADFLSVTGWVNSEGLDLIDKGNCRIFLRSVMC